MVVRVFAVVVAFTLVSGSLGASVSVPAEFRELVYDASLIVRGRVTTVRAVRAPDGEIDSIATVAVATVLKGFADTFISVVVPGGDMGRTRFVMVGAPQLRPNDTAVFFLKRGADNLWRPVGLSMGVFRVQPENGTGQPVIHPPVFLYRTASVGDVTRGDARRRTLSISEFDALVRAAAGAVTQPIRLGR
ncbi:MAG: hypothetical protein ABI051_15625 [Vicinamibacterales bacterium]